MNKYLIIFILALGIQVTGCATNSQGTTTKIKALDPFIEDYNTMIRWKRPEKAAPHVHPDSVGDYKKWSKKVVEDYEFHDWSMETVTYETEMTATVIIERTGYEIPKYIEKDFPVIQTWIFDENLGWRIKDGF